MPIYFKWRIAMIGYIKLALWLDYFVLSQSLAINIILWENVIKIVFEVFILKVSESNVYRVL